MYGCLYEDPEYSIILDFLLLLVHLSFSLAAFEQFVTPDLGWSELVKFMNERFNQSLITIKKNSIANECEAIREIGN